MAFGGSLLAGYSGQSPALHLGSSDSESHRTIWFILPTRGASHVIRILVSAPNDACSDVVTTQDHLSIRIEQLGPDIVKRNEI